MTFPRLFFTVDEENNICIHRQLRANEESLLMMSVPISEIIESEPDEIIKKMGITVLGMLQVLNKQAFGSWQLPKIE